MPAAANGGEAERETKGQELWRKVTVGRVMSQVEGRDEGGTK